MNGYEKLRLKIKELEEEKRILIEESNSIECITIKARHLMSKQIEKVIWYGDATKNESK